MVLDFAYEGGGVGKGGKATLLVNGKPVAEGRIEKTQPNIFSADETADVGIDNQTPVAEGSASARTRDSPGRSPRSPSKWGSSGPLFQIRFVRSLWPRPSIGPKADSPFARSPPRLAQCGGAPRVRPKEESLR